MSMDIALVRVDDRLIHGQILEAWLPAVHASCIVVVDDEVAGDIFRETVIRMAVPRNVEVTVCGVEEFARNFSYGTGEGKRTIVLFSSIADALKVFLAGFRFTRLNLGNVHNIEGGRSKMECSSCVFLGERDMQSVKSLMEAGVKVELQRIPPEAPVDLRNILPS